MRIIDKRNDYYDNVVPYSSDPIWVRKSKSVYTHDPLVFSKEEKEFIKELVNDISVYANYTRIHIIGCCGKLHCVFSINDGNSSEYIVTTDFLKIKPIIKSKTNFDISYSFFRRKFEKLSEKQLKEWLDLYNNTKFYNLFIKFKSPLFLIKPHKGEIEIEINPVLAPLKLQKVFDPWTLYQDIEMFLGNDLVYDKLDDFTMTDELKRDSKGFDNWSFKKKVR